MTTTMILLRLAVAAIFGGLIGLERDYRSKDAGFRTHVLVALGSALFMIVSQYGFADIIAHGAVGRFDPSRVAAQVVSGMGFLGAGCIILQKNVVKGLTTAAGLWVTSAIGLACGGGLFLPAVATVVLLLLCLEVINSSLPKMGRTVITVGFKATSKMAVTAVLDRLHGEDIVLASYEMKHAPTAEGDCYKVTMEIKVRRDRDQHRLLNTYLAQFDDISIDSFE